MRIAELNLNQINRELARIDDLHKRLAALEKQVSDLHQTVNKAGVAHANRTSINNLVFTWNGTGSSISWGAGFIKDLNGNNYAVSAGSLAASPSTYYWMAFSISQDKVVASTNLDGLLQNQDLLVISQIFTGTAAQTATAGGGGSSATGGSDLSGGRYKLL